MRAAACVVLIAGAVVGVEVLDRQDGDVTRPLVAVGAAGTSGEAWASASRAASRADASRSRYVASGVAR